MGDKWKKTSEVPSREPLKFRPNIPPRKKAHLAITDMKPLDEAENIVDRELPQKSKLSHEGSESKSAAISTKPESVHIDEGESVSANSFGISAGNIDGSKHQDVSDTVIPSKEKYDQPWKMDSLSSHSSSSDDSDPEFPDKEFREAPASSTQDENAAEELGLLNESEEKRMLFFQLPQALPFEKLPAVAGRRKEKGWGLHELPAGYMGKMMVYKSGKVKMKLGETLFDVSPGVERVLPRYVAAINTKEKHCCIIGNIDKHAVVTPDLDSLMDECQDVSPADDENLLALSSKKECAEPSQQNEGIPLDSGDTDEEPRKNYPSVSPYPDQNKDSDQDQTKIKPEKEPGLMTPSSLPVAKQPNAAAAHADKGKEIKAEEKYWARDATSNRLKRIEDKSSKKSDGNIQEDAGA